MSGEKKIGLLGGSFNPPHLGHVAMARHVLAEKRVEEVWVIPCFEHPFAKPLAPFGDRQKMCELAFQKLGKLVRILDVEKKLGGKSFTFRTVKYLQKEYPAYPFILIVGEDAASEAVQWDHYEELKKIIPWCVIPRGQNSPIPDISAETIRKAIKENKNLADLLSKEVMEYIKRHRLYEYA